MHLLYFILMFDWQMVYEPTLQLGDILLRLSSGLILRRQPMSPSFCHRWSGRVSPGRQWQQGSQGHRWHMQPMQLYLSKAIISSHRKSASNNWECFYLICGYLWVIWSINLYMVGYGWLLFVLPACGSFIWIWWVFQSFWVSWSDAASPNLSQPGVSHCLGRQKLQIWGFNTHTWTLVTAPIEHWTCFFCAPHIAMTPLLTMWVQ